MPEQTVIALNRLGSGLRLSMQLWRNELFVGTPVVTHDIRYAIVFNGITSGTGQWNGNLGLQGKWSACRLVSGLIPRYWTVCLYPQDLHLYRCLALTMPSLTQSDESHFGQFIALVIRINWTQLAESILLANQN